MLHELQYPKGAFRLSVIVLATPATALPADDKPPYDYWSTRTTKQTTPVGWLLGISVFRGKLTQRVAGRLPV